MKLLLLGLISIYRASADILRAAGVPLFCRYTPSCSEYGRDAIRQFGSWQGTRMTAARILRCHPFHAAGFDPVPPSK